MFTQRVVAENVYLHATTTPIRRVEVSLLLIGVVNTGRYMQRRELIILLFELRLFDKVVMTANIVVCIFLSPSIRGLGRLIGSGCSG